jgi:ribosomal protein L31
MSPEWVSRRDKLPAYRPQSLRIDTGGRVDRFRRRREKTDKLQKGAPKKR